MSTILIVEDEMIIALGAQMVLEDAGYTVLSASNGEAGLAEAMASSPDLILTDYMMPKMDGLSMISALRERGSTAPVILATAIPESSLRANPHPPYDAYLAKPYQDRTLLQAVRRLLSEGSGPA